jgi:hypothetical protein
MTVQELTNKLQNLGKDFSDKEVLLSMYGEGHFYNSIKAIVPAIYNEEPQAVGVKNLTEELDIMGFGSEESVVGGVPVVILFPD